MAPSSNESRRVSESSEAVSMSTGTAVSSGLVRKPLSTAWPSICGMFTSSTTTSGLISSIKLNALKESLEPMTRSENQRGQDSLLES